MKNLFAKTALAVALTVSMLAVPLTAMAVDQGNGTASVSVSAPESVKPGDTVTFTVTVSADENISGVSADVVTSEGLTPAGISGGLVSHYSTDSEIKEVDGTSASSSMTIAYSYTVTAEAGATLTFDLSNIKIADEGALAMAVNGTAGTTVKVAATEPTPGGDEPTPDTPSEPSNPSNPSTPSGTTDKKPADSGLDDVPKTGDATSNMMVYAIVAIAAAGAVAVVSVKKFAR